MGNKMSPETVENLMKLNHDKDDSIFISDNKYGYKVNISHPKIKPMYERFKKKIGCNILSDKERFCFESIIISMHEKKMRNIGGEINDNQRKNYEDHVPCAGDKSAGD